MNDINTANMRLDVMQLLVSATSAHQVRDASKLINDAQIICDWITGEQTPFYSHRIDGELLECMPNQAQFILDQVSDTLNESMREIKLAKGEDIVVSVAIIPAGQPVDFS